MTRRDNHNKRVEKKKLASCIVLVCNFVPAFENLLLRLNTICVFTILLSKSAPLDSVKLNQWAKLQFATLMGLISTSILFPWALGKYFFAYHV